MSILGLFHRKEAKDVEIYFVSVCFYGMTDQFFSVTWPASWYLFLLFDWPDVFISVTTDQLSFVSVMWLTS